MCLIFGYNKNYSPLQGSSFGGSPISVHYSMQTYPVQSQTAALVVLLDLACKERVNPLRLILIIFMQTLFMKSHYSGFYTCMRLMPRISYIKYPIQKRILPFCSAEKGLSSAIKFFYFGPFLP